MNSVPAWPFVLLVFGWVPMLLVLQSIPMVVGWRRLARRYPDSGETFVTERVYRYVLVKAGWFWFLRLEPRHHLALSRQGLRISASVLFRRLCPPILIPWSAISTLQNRPHSLLDLDGVKMEVARISSPVWVRSFWPGGDTFVVIQKYWEENRAILPEKAAFERNPA